MVVDLRGYILLFITCYLLQMFHIYVGLSLELRAYNVSSRELAIVVMYYRWYLTDTNVITTEFNK